MRVLHTANDSFLVVWIFQPDVPWEMVHGARLDGPLPTNIV